LIIDRVLLSRIDVRPGHDEILAQQFLSSQERLQVLQRFTYLLNRFEVWIPAIGDEPNVPVYLLVEEPETVVCCVSLAELGERKWREDGSGWSRSGPRNQRDC
jgi:hypothetical protein